MIAISHHYRLRLYPLIALFLILLAPTRAQAVRPQSLPILNSHHYTIHTDIDSALADELSRRMDAMYEEYARRLSDFAPAETGRNFEVYIFNSRDDYLEFIQNRFQNTGGVFMPARGLLAAFLEGQGRDALRRTLQHEAFHQFAHLAIGPNLPPWLNEGLAQVFEEGFWTGDGFLIGQIPPRRLRQLQEDKKNRRLMDFQTMLALTPEQWLKRMVDQADGITQYNQSWAMVHFLVCAKDESDNLRYRARLLRMLGLVKNGATATDAFTTAFSSNIKGFQDRFIEFIEEMKPTPEAMFIEYQEILGDMILELNRRGVAYNTADGLHNAILQQRLQMQYTKGAMKWTTPEDPRIYFQDLAGSTMGSDRMYFERAGRGYVLPALISRPTDQWKLMTRFYKNASGVTEHEVVAIPKS